MSDKKRRLRTRVNESFPVSFYCDEDKILHHGVMLNLSQSGLMIQTDEKLKMGSSICVKLPENYPGDSELEICAKIMRLTQEHPGSYLYGCSIC